MPRATTKSRNSKWSFAWEAASGSGTVSRRATIAGSDIANESTFQDIVPEKHIVMTSKMSLNGKPIVVMLATLEFVSAEAGTVLILTHQGAFLDWPDGPKMIESGWRSLLDRVATELSS